MLNPFFTFLRLFFQGLGALGGRGAAGRFRAQHSAIGLLGILLKAYCSAFRGMGPILGKRRAVQRLRKVGNGEIRRWFREWGIGARDIAFMD
jgi:hypothetical protein